MVNIIINSVCISKLIHSRLLIYKTTHRMAAVSIMYLVFYWSKSNEPSQISHLA